MTHKPASENATTSKMSRARARSFRKRIPYALRPYFRGQLLADLSGSAGGSRAPSRRPHVAGLAWKALETQFPIQDNGLETWLTYSRFDPDTAEGVAWPHNPAGFYAMLTTASVIRALVARARPGHADRRERDCPWGRWAYRTTRTTT